MKQELVVLIVAELFFLILPPFQVWMNSAVLLVPAPLITIGFFHAGVKSKGRPPSAEKLSEVFKWVGIVFSVVFGISVILTQGIAIARTLEFYYGLWQVAGLYYGALGVPYLLGLALYKWRMNAGVEQES